MRIQSLRVALIVSGWLGLISLVRLSVWPLVRIALSPASSATPAAVVPGAGPRIAVESVAAIAARDPFRAGRRPALPAYDPLRLVEQLAPPPPRPALVLVGVVEGSSPSAIIDGLPGVEGDRVVRAGDVIGPLTVKKVGNGRVVIVGLDTTWVLQVREPWKN